MRLYVLVQHWRKHGSVLLQRKGILLHPLHCVQNADITVGDWDPKGKGKKGKGKGKDSGKGKGTGPNGEKICFRFNQGRCSYKKCKFDHICSKCFKKGHNALNCKEGGPDTQGAN